MQASQGVGGRHFCRAVPSTQDEESLVQGEVISQADADSYNSVQRAHQVKLGPSRRTCSHEAFNEPPARSLCPVFRQ